MTAEKTICTVQRKIRQGITEKRIYQELKTIILFSLMSASPALGEKCRALRGDRGMFAYTGQSIIEKQKALLPSFLSGGSSK